MVSGAYIAISVFTRETHFDMGYIPLALLLGFVVYDTLLRYHEHPHVHRFTHTHDGATHTHEIVHSHSHFFTNNIHGHKHRLEELERIVTQTDKVGKAHSSKFF